MLSRNTLKGMSDDRLIASLKTLVAKRSRLTAELLCHISEVEERKLHLPSAYGSMFRFCVDGLGLSESMAYKHITVARAARKHETILTLVQVGRLHLSAAVVLCPHLTDDNCAELLEAAAGRSKRQVERLIAQRFPKADVPALVRKLPEPAPGQSCPGPGQINDSQLRLSAAKPGPGQPVVAKTAEVDQGQGAVEAAAFAVSNQSAAPVGPQPARDGASLASLTARGPGAHSPPAPGTGSSLTDGSRPTVEPTSEAPVPAPHTEPPAQQQRPRIEPLSAARYKVQFTASEQLVGKLRQAQELLRRQVPDGDPAVICERALDLLIESLLKKRFALSSRRSAAAQQQVGGDSSSASSATANKPVVEASQPEQDITAKPEPKNASQAGARPQKSRYIPASVRRQVAERDGLQCTYVGPDGKRCERRDVEFHHRSLRSRFGVPARVRAPPLHLTPFARGGQHTVEQITLRCRAHNAFQAELDYGAQHIAHRIRQQQARAGRRRAKCDRTDTERTAPHVHPAPSRPPREDEKIKCPCEMGSSGSDGDRGACPPAP